MAFLTSNIFSLLGLLALLVAPAAGAESLPLDREHISSLYFDGEFPQVIEKLETYRKSQTNMSKDDKIFVYKHLSVVYAADPANREKAESYMYQLLKIVPTIDLIDMYVSDNIKAIFQNVKSEYQQRQQYMASQDSPGGANNSGRENTPGKAASPQASQDRAPASPAPERANSAPRSQKWLWWSAGGVLVAGAVTGYVILGREAPEPKKVTFEIK